MTGSTLKKIIEEWLAKGIDPQIGRLVPGQGAPDLAPIDKAVPEFHRDGVWLILE
jgi:hypothetical protein